MLAKYEITEALYLSLDNWVLSADTTTLPLQGLPEAKSDADYMLYTISQPRRFTCLQYSGARYTVPSRCSIITSEQQASDGKVIPLLSLHYAQQRRASPLYFIDTKFNFDLKLKILYSLSTRARCYGAFEC